MIYIFYLQHINAYLCLLSKRIKLGIYIDQSIRKFALTDAYFFASISRVLVCMFKLFFYFDFLTLCFISIIQSLLEGIWKVDHSNYDEDKDQPATSIPVADANYFG